MTRERHYRREVERARQLAREAKLPNVREVMLKAAAGFERLANLVNKLKEYRRAEEQTLATLHSLEDDADSASNRHPKRPRGEAARGAHPVDPAANRRANRSLSSPPNVDQNPQHTNPQCHSGRKCDVADASSPPPPAASAAPRSAGAIQLTSRL